VAAVHGDDWLSHGRNDTSAVLENARRENNGRRLKKCDRRAILDKIFELLVVQLAVVQLLLPPALGDLEASAEIVDGIHRTRVDDVVAGDQRSISVPGR
jgi:hypothetical protein